MADLAGDYRDRERARAYGKRSTTTRAETRAVSRLVADLPRPRTVIDVPCGNGRLAPLLLDLGAGNLVGVDGSLEMAAIARRSGEAALRGDAGALPLADRCADLVLCSRLLHHFRDRGERVRILRELARVARGPVIVSFYLRWTLEGLRRRLRPKRPSSRSGLTVREVRRDAEEAGLRIDRVASLLPLVREQTFVRFSGARPCRGGCRRI